MTDMRPKRSLLSRTLDKVPLFGTARRAKGWMRRNKGWIYLGLVIVILFIVRPVLMLIADVFHVLRGPIGAMLNNPVGSLIFYNVFGLLLLWWLWRRVRARVYRTIGLAKMRHFLNGLTAMVMGHWRRAIPEFERVAKTPRWIKLQDAVPEHRDIRIDAYLKIAACHLRMGSPNEAKAWLLRVREKDMLTEHTRRQHAELRALSYDLNDDMEEETVLRELERTQLRDKANRRVLRALRDRNEAAGDLEKAREFGKRLVASTDGAEQEEAERDLALIAFRSAHRALGEGDRKSMTKALKGRHGDVRAALLLGDEALERGDVQGALRAWGRAVSLPVFDRLAQMLESGKLDGDKERDLVLRLFPYAGTLIVLAEYHRKRGEFKKARAALEKVLEGGGGDLTSLRLYADCLSEEGDHAQAAEFYRRALAVSLT
ncbi:MAG: tetratricopeptide repeat protein [Planctomycetota bacterium]|jgi:tetratricopeptide (TPR) repeat protein